MKNRWVLSAITICAAITFSVDAKADDFTEGWAFEVTPYAWLADINGDVTVNSTEARTKDSFSDLYDGVDLSGSLLGVVRKDRFLIWAQADYLGLDSDNLDAAPPNASLETYTTHLGTAVGYQFEGLVEGSIIDAMIGLRYGHFETKATINGVRTGEETTDVVDPMLVVRPNVPITDWIMLNPILGVGGGGDSDFIFDLQPQLHFQFTKHFATRVGYRRLHYKYQSDQGHAFDATIQGFIVGVGYTF
jgi:opacity protein-like surface antigen